MKILFFFLSLFFLTITQAQTINKPVFCGEQTEMASALEKLKEFPIWSSPSPVEKSLYIFFTPIGKLALGRLCRLRMASDA